MIEATINEMKTKGFLPLFPEDWSKQPQYAEYADGKIIIFMQHMGEERYLLHRARDSNLKGYFDYDFEENGLERITILNELIPFLQNPDRKLRVA